MGRVMVGEGGRRKEQGGEREKRQGLLQHSTVLYMLDSVYGDLHQYHTTLHFKVQTVALSCINISYPSTLPQYWEVSGKSTAGRFSSQFNQLAPIHSKCKSTSGQIYGIMSENNSNGSSPTNSLFQTLSSSKLITCKL